MKGRLFLVHWNAAEAAELAAPFEQAGWQVESEAEDGARAGKRILANPPACERELAGGMGKLARPDEKGAA